MNNSLFNTIKKPFQHYTLWWIFALFTLLLFVKSLLFHTFCFEGLCHITALWKNPGDFFYFYLPKLLPAMAIASFVFLTKKHYWWTIVVAALADLWIIANIVYFRANNLFLGINEIFMVNNMHGTWKSVATYFRFSYLWFPMLTVIYSVLLLWLFSPVKKRSWISFLVMLLVMEGCSFHRTLKENRYSEDKHYTCKYLNPLGGTLTFIENYWDSSHQYLRDYSILSYFPMAIGRYINQVGMNRDTRPTQEEISPLLQANAQSVKAPRNLIIILVESLESWALATQDSLGNLATPNLSRFMNSEHVAYCPYTTSQTRSGTSGDGQLTLTTGLLPLNTGVACMQYGWNTYPSYANLYDTSTLINPWPHIWNQDAVTISYGYKNLVEPEHGNFIDKEVFEQLVQQTRQLQSPYYLCAITVSSHSPFNLIDHYPLQFSPQTPDIIYHYLNMIHYTDSCFGMFLQEFEQSEELQNSTIVITGDHIVFYENMLEEFHASDPNSTIPFPDKQSYVPFIVYSPNITEHQVVTDTVYQMDIFPTVLHQLDCEDYYWKGLGVNILNDSLRQNRPLTEDEAYKLSNKIIVNNYFKSYLDSICQQQ